MTARAVLWTRFSSLHVVVHSASYPPREGESSVGVGLDLHTVEVLSDVGLYIGLVMKPKRVISSPVLQDSDSIRWNSESSSNRVLTGESHYPFFPIVTDSPAEFRLMKFSCRLVYLVRLI